MQVVVIIMPREASANHGLPHCRATAWIRVRGRPHFHLRHLHEILHVCVDEAHKMSQTLRLEIVAFNNWSGVGLDLCRCLEVRKASWEVLKARENMVDEQTSSSNGRSGSHQNLQLRDTS